MRRSSLGVCDSRYFYHSVTLNSNWGQKVLFRPVLVIVHICCQEWGVYPGYQPFDVNHKALVRSVQFLLTDCILLNVQILHFSWSQSQCRCRRNIPLLWRWIWWQQWVQRWQSSQILGQEWPNTGTGSKGCKSEIFWQLQRERKSVQISQVLAQLHFWQRQDCTVERDFMCVCLFHMLNRQMGLDVIWQTECYHQVGIESIAVWEDSPIPCNVGGQTWTWFLETFEKILRLQWKGV